MNSFLADDISVRPGEEGFTSFPKRLPEDCVSYVIFVVNKSSQDEKQQRAELKRILDASTELKKELFQSYIWQREPFELAIKREHGRLCLSGRTGFGDSLADEWAIVFLLRELCKKFNDAWLRVHDGDGEFLLIEAANALPTWLNPEIADNRVWMNCGKLYIIPFSPSKGKSKATSVEEKSTVLEKRNINTEDALALIRSSPDSLINSSEIELEAFYRIRNHPAAIADSFHTSRVTIPRILAFVLQRAPAHISPAIEAFYLRDPVSIKPLQAGSIADLCFPPTDLVDMSVRFTRVGFAQLKSQEFLYPDVWKDAEPRTQDTKKLGSAELGMKLACAFEMLVSDEQNQDKRCVREIKLLIEDVISGEEALPSDEEIVKWPAADDDESWLDVNFEDFERELAGRMPGVGGQEGGKNGAFGDKAAQENLRRVVERFEQFLKDEGAGIEGVNEHDEMDEDDDDDDDDDVDVDDIDEEEDEVLDDKKNTGYLEEVNHTKKEESQKGPGKDRLQHREEREGDYQPSFILEQEPAFQEELVRAFHHLMHMPSGSNAIQTMDGELEVKDKREEEDAFDESDNEDDETEKQHLQDMMKGIEDELKGLGALDNSYDSNEEQREILAKNLLESLRGEGAIAGPSANLLNSFGIRLPPDKDKGNRSLR